MFKCIMKFFGLGESNNITEAELKKMTKKEVDEWAASKGINLDRRLTKAKMIDNLKQHIVVE